jgi:hypothetical protein
LRLATIHRGASIRDRFLAGVPASVGTFAVIAAIIWVLQFG